MAGSIQLSASDFLWGFEVNGQPVPPLTDGWLEKVEAVCPAKMTETSKQKLRGTVENYLFQRFALATSTSRRNLKSKLAEMEKAATALLHAVEIYDHGDALAWQVLESIKSPPPVLKRDDVYPIISLLVNRAHIASIDAMAQSKETQSTFKPKKVWEDFAKGLVMAFEQSNWQVKITKSNGNLEGAGTVHPSIFVNFAWAVMDSIPKALREHCSSRWTLANALQAVRAKTKAI